MKLFHRHTFDPSGWKQVSVVSVVEHDIISYKEYQRGEVFLYSNTCKECGDLVFRRVREIE